MGFFKDELSHIKAFVFDVDGVLSKAQIVIDNDGNLMRTGNTKDGFAIQLAIRLGYPIAIITGGDSPAVTKRYKGLGVQHVYTASRDKVADLNDFLKKTGVKADEVLYMGDDMPDWEIMQVVRLATCPKDAVQQIKSISAYISEISGGEGCVRDVVEQVLRAHGKWIHTDMTSVKSI